jgi:hypothetical protein
MIAGRTRGSFPIFKRGKWIKVPAREQCRGTERPMLHPARAEKRRDACLRGNDEGY